MSRWSGPSEARLLPGAAKPGSGVGASLGWDHTKIFTKMSSLCLVSTLRTNMELPYLVYLTTMTPPWLFKCNAIILN